MNLDRIFTGDDENGNTQPSYFSFRQIWETFHFFAGDHQR
jgi:hypothetical protein